MVRYNGAMHAHYIEGEEGDLGGCQVAYGGHLAYIGSASATCDSSLPLTMSHVDL